jgi:hypothetical protein
MPWHAWVAGNLDPSGRNPTLEGGVKLFPKPEELPFLMVCLAHYFTEGTKRIITVGVEFN